MENRLETIWVLWILPLFSKPPPLQTKETLSSVIQIWLALHRLLPQVLFVHSTMEFIEVSTAYIFKFWFDYLKTLQTLAVNVFKKNKTWNPGLAGFWTTRTLYFVTWHWAWTSQPPPPLPTYLQIPTQLTLLQSSWLHWMPAGTLPRQYRAIRWGRRG